MVKMYGKKRFASVYTISGNSYITSVNEMKKKIFVLN
jgi:hypothetical protein